MTPFHEAFFFAGDNVTAAINASYKDMPSFPKRSSRSWQCSPDNPFDSAALNGYLAPQYQVDLRTNDNVDCFPDTVYRSIKKGALFEAVFKRATTGPPGLLHLPF
jgi:hypothetical protein